MHRKVKCNQRFVVGSVFLLLVTVFAMSIYAQDSNRIGFWKKKLHSRSQGEQTQSVQAEVKSVPRGPVKSLEKIGQGCFPKWAPDGSLIAFTKEVIDRNDPNGIGYEIFIMKPDGGDARCLTCNKEGLANTGWRGQPYWHPSGKYITFTAETEKYPRKGNGTTARPGLGRNHNVWLMTSDGSRFWQLTDYPDNWGVIRPSFSHDGRMLYWCEEFSMEKYPNGKPTDQPRPHPGSYWGWESASFRKGEELGAWRVKIADLSFATGKPVISNIRPINPPLGFTVIEGEGFLPHDKGFVYSYCNLNQEGGKGFWGDIYVSDLSGESFRNLTKTPRVHDENAEFSSDGSKIVWNHGKGDPGEEELYLMNADGSNKVRLTYFTELGNPEYDPNAQQITESAWSPDGKNIVFGHVSAKSKGGPHLSSTLFKLTLK